MTEQFTDTACWECEADVPPSQLRHSLATLEAVICADCEPWVRHVLGLDTPEEMTA